MNCQDITRIVDSGKFSALTEAQRRDGEAHALSCRHCAPVWFAHARLSAMPLAPMPAEFAMQCQTLVAARAQGSVSRLVPRRMLIVVSSFVVLAAAAGMVTVKLIVSPADTPAPPRERAAVAPVQVVVAPAPVQLPDVPLTQPPAQPLATQAPPPPPVTQAPRSQPATQQPQHVQQVENGEPDMNKTASIAVTVAALGAAAVAPAQTATSGRQASAEQIIASNDLNKDGYVTKEEATEADKSLIKMWTFYDMDRDGRVTAAEVERATNAMLVATAEEKITGEQSAGPAMVKPESVIKSNDQNGDGIVTKEEATKTGGGLIRLWDIYDLDKDGKVDAAEIGKAQGY